MASRSLRPTAPTVSKKVTLTRRGSQGVKEAKVFAPDANLLAEAGLNVAGNPPTLPEKLCYGWLLRNASSLGIEWQSQAPAAGSYTRDVGSAVVDIEILAPVRELLRIQTNYFHVFADAGKIAADYMQKLALEQYAVVLDLYEDSIYADCDSVMRDALNGIQQPAPSGQGTPHRPLGV